MNDQPAPASRLRTGTRKVAALGLIGATLATVALLATVPAPDIPAKAGTVAERPTPSPSLPAPTVPATPAGATGTFTIPHGSPAAPVVVTIYEDFSCPYCARLEQYAGEPLLDLVDDGTVRVDHRPIAILDYVSTTGYSTRAANAYATVLHAAGSDAAERFRTLLFMNQPPEGSAGLTDADLVKAAGMAGADRALVEPLIRTGAFGGWVERATAAAARENINATPTVYVNDRKVADPFDGSLPTLISRAVEQGTR